MTCLLIKYPPLAIQEFISILSSDPGHNLNGDRVERAQFIFAPGVRSKTSLLVLITKEDMKDIYDTDDITTDLLGFYSLLMSYVNIAATAVDQGKYSPISLVPPGWW